MYLAWQLAQAGWFDRIPSLFKSGSTEGFSGGLSDLVLDILPYLVNTVCLFGSIAIAFYGFMLKAIKPTARKLARLLDDKLEGLGYDLWDFSDEPKPIMIESDLDIDELEDTIEILNARLAALEESK